MMSKAQVLQALRHHRVIPVIRAGLAREAEQLADAILDGGLPVLEITMTVPDAVHLIDRLVKRLDGAAIVGAGSVLNAEDAAACIAAGARFIASPTFEPEVIACGRDHGVVIIAGALTPTEVLRAWNAGADLVKVFPAAALGGASYVRALKGPLPQIKLVPTGGVTLATAASYIEAGAAAVGAGSDLANVESIRAGRPDDVSAAARAYVDAVRKARPPFAAP